MQKSEMLLPSIRGGGHREAEGQVGMTPWYQCPFNSSFAGQKVFQIFPLRAMACGLLVPSKDEHNYHKKIYSCVNVCACSDILLRRLVPENELLSRIDGTLAEVFLDMPLKIMTTKAYHP